MNPNHSQNKRQHPAGSLRSRSVWQSGLLLLALLLIIIGASSGEALAVFHKAAFICLECIGIG